MTINIPKELRAEVIEERRAPRKAHRAKSSATRKTTARKRPLRLGALDARHDGDNSQSRPERQVRRRLGEGHKNRRFAWDAYRRFVQMYSSVVIGLPKDDLEARLRKMKESQGVKDDTQVSSEGWRQLVDDYKEYFKQKTGKDFPEDPIEQLWGAIGAVFESWMGEKAVTYRRVEKITGLLGTAVNVVQMVFGNTGEDSGTGVCFTRDPSTGEKTFFGDFLLNAQGEDVVAESARRCT